MAKKDLVFLANQAITGNYLRKVINLAKTKGPGVHMAEVQHDSWCDLLAEKGPCNCNPDVYELPLDGKPQ